MLINSHSPYLGILNKDEERGMEGNISPSFLLISLIFVHPSNEGNKKGEEFFDS